MLRIGSVILVSCAGEESCANKHTGEVEVEHLSAMQTKTQMMDRAQSGDGNGGLEDSLSGKKKHYCDANASAQLVEDFSLGEIKFEHLLSSNSSFQSEEDFDHGVNTTTECDAIQKTFRDLHANPCWKEDLYKMVPTEPFAEKCGSGSKRRNFEVFGQKLCKKSSQEICQFAEKNIKSFKGLLDACKVSCYRHQEYYFILDRGINKCGGHDAVAVETEEECRKAAANVEARDRGSVRLKVRQTPAKWRERRPAGCYLSRQPFRRTQFRWNPRNWTIEEDTRTKKRWWFGKNRRKYRRRQLVCKSNKDFHALEAR